MRCELNLVNGTPVFAEDQYEWPHKWEKPVLMYQVLKGTEDVRAGDKLRKAVGIALSTWGAEIPLKFAHIKRGGTPDITIRFENDPRADKIFMDKPTVLAYAYYPKTGSYKGKIVFNDFRYEWGTKDEWVNGVHVYNVIQVLIHEIGHSLGLSHDTSNSGKDILDAFYDGKMVDLSANDIYRIRKKYGTRMYRRWNLYMRFKRYLAYRKRHF